MSDPFLPYWQEVERPEFGNLAGDENAEAVIVGGGLCGLLCAYELWEKGVRSIVLLESGQICGGTTSRTTGKITSQHDLIYNTLIAAAGEEFARGYAQANERAIGRYREIIEKEKISCDFVSCPAYLYGVREESVRKLEDEAVAAQMLSIDAEFTKDCELPFPVAGAVRFGGQARFHPLKFAYALAKLLVEREVKIYENTEALELEDNTVFTKKGRVYGKYVFLCTRYPFMNLRGFYFARIVQSRSYLLALEGAPKIEGMYLGCDEKSLSFRWQEDPCGGVLLLGGGTHKTGHEGDVLHYAPLEESAADYFPKAAVRCRWSAEDCETSDGIPFIGHYSQFGRRVFLATGFRKWGMTGSMVAAELLSNLAVSGKSEYETVFSPGRPTVPLQTKQFLTQTGDTVVNFVRGYAAGPDKTLPELKNGEAGYVEYHGEKIGAYRDGEGALYGVKPYCRHMHCPLSWNAEEKTWDCPCHGSRYDAGGRLLEGPALRSLKKRGPD